jgi:MscS family membrane protein
MPKMDKILQNVYQIAIILGITWIVVNVLNGVIRKVLSSHPERSAKIDDNVIHILTRTVSGIIWALGVVMALSNVGINVGGIIAGLGIGGVAFALASQDTIKNIFAGVVIFIDRPFRLGDNIRIDSNTGIVEDIGLRSVRIRTPDKKLVIISSSKAIDSVIENISQEPARRITLLLGLTYDTTPEKMNLALSLLRDLPTSIRAIKGSTPYFTNYGDSALTITFIYFIRKGEDIMETQSKVNLAILTQFNENKLNFAFPTQTIYIEKADS